MRTVFEHIRERLYAQCGIERPRPPGTVDEINRDIAKKHAELDKVVALAKNRLIMGTMRYGVGDDAHDKYDYGAEIIRRAEKYRSSGNLEFLVDALNFCALEYNHPHIKGAHFTTIDDGEHSIPIE